MCVTWGSESTSTSGGSSGLRRRRSSSGSRRSRPRGRRSGTYSPEQGSQCALGGGGAQAAQGEAGQAEGDQVHRGHSVHWEEEKLKRLKEKQAKRKEIRYIQSRTGGHSEHWKEEKLKRYSEKQAKRKKIRYIQSRTGSQCTLGGGGAQAPGREEGDQVHTVQNRGHSVHWEEEELKRLKEKQAKRKEIRYVQYRKGVTVYTGRRMSSSGSRRSRSRGRRSGTYSPEKGVIVYTGRRVSSKVQGEAGQAEGDQVHTVQKRGHSVHCEEEELKRLKEKQVKRKEIRYIQSRRGVVVYTGRKRSSSG
jgi:hypothetical protein